MKKRVAALAICTLMLFSFMGTVLAENTEEKIYTLSLSEAIKIASENNPQFISLDTKITDAKKQLAQAQKERRNVKNVAVRLPSGLSTVAIQQGYYVSQAEITLQSAEMEKEQAVSRLSYDVTQKYYNVKLCEALLESAKAAYSLSGENKNTIDTQYSLGLVSKLDTENAKYALNQTKAALDMYGRNYDIAKMGLLIALGIDTDASLVLTDGIQYEEYSVNLEEDTKKAMESRYDIYSLKSVFEQSKRYADITEILGKNSSQYSSANQLMVQSEYTYNNTRKMISLSINSCYNEILNAKDSLVLAEENLSLKKQEYNIVKLQYELGLTTSTALSSSLSAVTSAEIELENKKLSYKLATEKYKYEIKIGL